MASWSVCSTVAEPPELLCAFAAHYLELGAQEVHLFLDVPDRKTVRMLSAIDGVRVTQCNWLYWAKAGGQRPKGQVMRQLRNANIGYAECRSDWFFFCDADEYLTASGDIGAMLDEMPREARSCRPEMAERVFDSSQPQEGIFDGFYRRLLPPRSTLAQDVYGDLAPMTTRGLTGHILGKSFVRSGQDDLRIRIHFPVPRDSAEETRLRAEGALKPGPFLPESWLVHFDGLTPLHWQLKLLRFYLDYAPTLAKGKKEFSRRTAARSRQLNMLYESRGDATALARMMGLIRLDPAQLECLQAGGGLLQGFEITPAVAAARRFSRKLSFDAADFDAALEKKYHKLISEHGLTG